MPEELEWPGVASLLLPCCDQADPRGIPGVKELAVPFNSYEDLVRIQRNLEQIQQQVGRGGGHTHAPADGVGGEEERW